MTEQDVCKLYSPLVENTARRFMRTRAVLDDDSIELEDLFQEGYLGLLQGIRSNKTEDGKISTPFMKTCVINKLTDVARKISSRSRGGTLHMEPETTKLVPLTEANNIPASDLIGTYEMQESVRKIIDDNLPVRDAEMLCLYFGIGSDDGEGMSPAEIGELFEVSRQRVEFIIRRAMSHPEFVQQLQEIVTNG